MNIKKTIGWTLACFGAILFTSILAELTSLKEVILSYIFTLLIVGFVILVIYLIAED